MCVYVENGTLGDGFIHNEEMSWGASKQTKLAYYHFKSLVQELRPPVFFFFYGLPRDQNNRLRHQFMESDVTQRQKVFPNSALLPCISLWFI